MRFVCFQSWISDIQEFARDDVIMMLLGNKADLTNERVVKTAEGQQLAEVT